MNEKMKRKIRKLLLCLPVLLLVSCSSVRHPYTQEYHAGQGNIKGNVETVCCLYHQKKDFISVPYEPKDAEYLKKTK